MSARGGSRQPRNTKGRKSNLWQAIHQKVLPLGLMALTVVLIASVPLTTSTQREAAEYKITTLHWDILRLQEKKARLLRESSDRLTLKNLEELGASAGLQPPARIEYIAPTSAP